MLLSCRRCLCCMWVHERGWVSGWVAGILGEGGCGTTRHAPIHSACPPPADATQARLPGPTLQTPAQAPVPARLMDSMELDKPLGQSAACRSPSLPQTGSMYSHASQEGPCAACIGARRLLFTCLPVSLSPFSSLPRTHCSDVHRSGGAEQAEGDVAGAAAVLLDSRRTFAYSLCLYHLLALPPALQGRELHLAMHRRVRSA